MKKILVLVSLSAVLVSGCWSGVQVVEDGDCTHNIVVGDMSCVSCEYEITASNAVINVVFRKDAGK